MTQIKKNIKKIYMPRDIILNEGTNKAVIETMTVFVTVDEKGNEGIVAQLMGATWVPFVCADEERVKSFIPQARKLQLQTKEKIRILRFSTKEDVTDKYDL